MNDLNEREMKLKKAMEEKRMEKEMIGKGKKDL
jgi:hypothetical protein